MTLCIYTPPTPDTNTHTLTHTHTHTHTNTSLKEWGSEVYSLHRTVPLWITLHQTSAESRPHPYQSQHQAHSSAVKKSRCWVGVSSYREQTDFAHRKKREIVV